MRSFILLVVLALLVGCSSAEQKKNHLYATYTGEHFFKVLEVDPSEYFRVRIQTGDGHHINFSSKRCDDWEKLKEGVTYKAQFQYTVITNLDTGNYEVTKNLSVCDIASKVVAI